MRTHETFLHSMTAHHAKRYDTRSRYGRETINRLEVIGEIQSPTVKLHMAIGAEAEDIAVDVRSSLTATESMNVRTLGIILSTGIHP